MALIEKQGVPTASLVFKGLVKAWEQSASAFGFADLPIAVIQQTFNSAPPAEIESMEDVAIDPLVPGVTKGVARKSSVRISTKADQAETLTFDGEDLLEAFNAMNALFLRDEWSDGMLLSAPTPKAVAETLKHTKR